ncbi:hypothetical protein ALC57_08639, partial [Trachymyrmex cornetzi]
VSNSFIGVNNIRGSSISPAPTIAPRMIWVYLKARLKHRISHFFIHLMTLHADKVSCACHILNGYYARMRLQTIRHFNISDTPLVVSLAKSNIPGFSSGKYNRALILNGTSVE